MNQNQRPLWIIIFAILLASIAIRTKGQEISSAGPPTGISSSISDSNSDPEPETVKRNTIQVGDQIYYVERSSRKSPVEGAVTDSVPVESHHWGRPKYAFVSAELAQLDGDADPDGWLAHIVLMDADDQPTLANRATAKFELVPRVPTHDFTGYVDANVKSLTWSMPLQFNRHAIGQPTATVRLKLRHPIVPLMGWPATSHPAVGSAGGFFSSRRGIIRHATPSMVERTELTDSRRRGGALDAIGLASFGELKVRVSVPGEGVFDAVAPIALRPSVLVDTRWPYQ